MLSLICHTPAWQFSKTCVWVSSPAATVQWGHLSSIKLLFFSSTTIMSQWLLRNLCMQRDENISQTVWNDDNVNFIRLWCTMKLNHTTYLCVGLGWRRKMAQLLPTPSVSCDVSYYPYFHRGQRQLCAHVKTEREAIVIAMDLCLSQGKRQNLSFPAEPRARCWRGLAQQATLMSPRSWIVLLSALAVSRLLWRKFFCFFCQCLFIYFTNVISAYHDESANVRQIERET